MIHQRVGAMFTALPAFVSRRLGSPDSFAPGAFGAPAPRFVPTIAPVGNQFGPPPPTQTGPPAGFDLGPVTQQVEESVCNRIPNAIARAACVAATRAAAGLLPDPAGAEPGELPLVEPCPPGQVLRNGQCVTEGVRGTIERILPGGRAGTLADVAGEAVVGSFGLPAFMPMQVGTITRNDGGVSPILRCPARTVLGADNLCYVKGTLPRAWRKHPPGPRPLLSAQDGKVLTRARTLERKLKRVSGRFIRPPARRAAPRRRKC